MRSIVHQNAMRSTRSKQPATIHQRPSRWATLRRDITCGCASLLAIVLALTCYLWWDTPLPDPQHLRLHTTLGNTRILDRNGKLLYELPQADSGHQQPIPLHDIPLALQQATIATEDRSFYQNTGIDLRGILRSIQANLLHGEIVAGGSTITQQLARNLLLHPELARQRTLERKLREIVMALKLTASVPKDDILAMYLNQSYYGGLSYGVEAAAWHYFGKPVRDLDLAESALLAGLPQAPSYYDPLNNPDAARQRQHNVLDAMLQLGFISSAQADAARNEPLQFASDHRTMQAPHFVYYVLNQLETQLAGQSGLTITTTLDLDLQNAAQTTLQRQLASLAVSRPDQPDHQVHNGAVVVLDPSSGNILAMVGSPNFDNAAIQGQVNAAVALRQPGSAIKPLTYAAALEQGMTPATPILDIPTTFTTREGTLYSPQNYDRTFHGPLSLREALATSSNVSAVRVLNTIGIPALLEMATRLGITTLLRQDSGRYGLALTLGGGEVTLLELTSAYGAFATGGYRVTPHTILAIDGGRRVTSDERPAAILRPEIAYLISDILSDRYARMRAFGAQSVLDIDRPAAVKTGTTTDWRDNWTVGYTPDRVVGVWVGNADGQSMEQISGITGAGPVWQQVMLAAHRGLPPRPFARPDGIVEVAICAEGGMLPSSTCPATRLERFIAGTQPMQPDTTHVAVAIDPHRHCRVNVNYPREQAVVRIFRILPPEAEAWALDAGVPRIPRQSCGPITQDASTITHHVPQTKHLPALVHPASGATYTISPGVPRDRQRIELQATAGTTIRTGIDPYEAGLETHVTILVDDQPVAHFTQPPYRTLWTLTPGQHRVRVTTQDGQGIQRESEEVIFTVTE